MSDQQPLPDDSGESGEDKDLKSSASLPGSALLNHHMRYVHSHAWLLLFSALDVIMTWIILNDGGREVNPIADAVIDAYGLDGMIVYKFVLIAFFIVICEAVGTLRDSAGRSLSRVSVAIAMVPVVWSLILLTYNPNVL